MDIILFLWLSAAYVVAMLGLVVLSRYRKTGAILPTTEEFFLASRKMLTPLLSLTFLASLYSAALFIAFPGMVFDNGISGILFVLV